MYIWLQQYGTEAHTDQVQISLCQTEFDIGANTNDASGSVELEAGKETINIVESRPYFISSV